MPNFFEHVDATGVVENHIKQVLELEDDQAKIILKRYQEVRRDLVDRLSTMRGGTFTAQHLRGTLAQVEGAITAITEHLQGAMVKGAYVSALKGVQHLTKELNVFDEKFTGAVTPINLNAALIAQDTSQLLITRYNTNLARYGSNLYAEISNGLFSATLGETNQDEVIGRISQFFNGKEWELHRIVRTELHGIYNRGKLAGMKKLVDEDVIPDMKRTLIHPMDARTGDDSKYAARLHLVAEMDKPFVYTWKGDRREFFTPPDRPNDRSVMVPYRESWGDDQPPSFLPF